jgi:regulator of replication initiation timing
MKKIYILAAMALFSSFAFAQARLTTSEFQKVMQPAVEIEVPFPEKTVMKTIVDMLEKKGYKGKDTKGYYTFKGVVLSELGTDSYDLYFKADRKSRSQKDNTILTLLVSGGYEKFIGDSTGSALIGNVKAFLNKQIDASAAYDLEMQITEQDETSKNAQKKLTSLVEDGQSLQKKKEKLEKEIQDNIKKQADQKAEAEKQMQIFNTLKGKRKQ